MAKTDSPDDGKYPSMAKEYRREYSRRYREQNRERLREYFRQYYLKNHPDAYKKRKWYAMVDTKDMTLYRREYKKNRKKSDDVYAFSERVREMVRQSFRRRDLRKNKRTMEILGCTFPELDAHLKKTWFDRYGFEYNGQSSHIDHIIPLSSAATKEEVVRLCHYTNLQLLTPEDNIRKGASM